MSVPAARPHAKEDGSREPSSVDNSPAQLPLPAAAGFLTAIEGRKPNKVADRIMRVLALPGLTGNEVRVLAALAFHDGPGGAWPSDDTIAQESGVRLRGAVFAARKSLQEKGRLRWEHGRHTNHYRIAYGEPGEFHCPGNSESGANDTLSGKFGSHCPGNPDMNRKEPRRSAAGLDAANIRDLCEPPGACQRAAFVEVGSECDRCGWRRRA